MKIMLSFAFASAQTYFKPALKNVRDNLDDTSITDDYVSFARRSCDKW